MTPPDFLYWYKAKVLKIVDGDTIDTLTDLGFRIQIDQRLRFYGINTPELNSSDPVIRAAAQASKDYVSAMIPEGSQVILNTYKDRTEKYGRWLAVIYYPASDGSWTNLNTEMVSKGLAVVYFP